MARRYMSKQHLGHTYQATELIHETYLKLARSQKQNWQNREHFFGVASKAMRHILVDYAKSKSRNKRGGWQKRITFTEGLFAKDNAQEEIITLDETLKKLADLDERKVRVVEMKFFGGLKVKEIAEVLKISK